MKRTLAFILTLVMVLSSFGMLSVVVSAEGEETATTTPQMVTLPEGYTQPEGEGTAENPYLIASAADLLWMAQQLDPGIVYGTVPCPDIPATVKDKTPFKGKYFKQVNDIDLNGNMIPSIGSFNGVSYNYANLHGSKYMVFGGTYDGCGFAIQNGYILTQDPKLDEINYNQKDWCSYYPTGLFGVILGATIQNVKLKNMKLYTENTLKISSAGLLVGIAAASPATAGNTGIVNRIINCTTDSMCEMVAVNIPTNIASSSREYNWGGIVGAAYRTDIVDCENNAKIQVNGAVSHAGGIVGQLLNGTVSNCRNNSNIIVVANASAQKANTYRSYGGLVGQIPNDNNDNGTPNVTIENSVNFGNITSIGDLPDTFACGGIVGTIWKVSQDATIRMETSYNLGFIQTTAKEGVQHSEGAIIGNIHAMNGNDATKNIVLQIENVFSIPQSELNEGRVSFGSATSDVSGEYYGMRASDGTLMCTWTNLTISDEAAKKEFADKIVKTQDWTCDNEEKVKDMIASCTISIQKHTSEEGNYRFLATINGAEWDSAAFTLTLIKPDGTKGTKTVDVTTCYDSILADGEAITDPSGRKFIVFAVSGIGEGWKYEISASVTDASGTYKSLVQAGEFG